MGQTPKPPGTFEAPLVTAFAVGGGGFRMEIESRRPIDGLEPPTHRLQGDCTTIVLYRLSHQFYNEGSRKKTGAVTVL